MNWTQPICEDCWERFFPHKGEPVRLIDKEPERCAWCGQVTLSGIYVRAHPDVVTYPTE
jgi:hypothetical protein